MPFPPKPSKKKDDEDFECFAEMIRPIFLKEICPRGNNKDVEVEPAIDLDNP